MFPNSGTKYRNGPTQFEDHPPASRTGRFGNQTCRRVETENSQNVPGTQVFHDCFLNDALMDENMKKFACAFAELATFTIATPTLERFSVDVNRNNEGVPRGAQIRFGLL
jgi:hypothetical protein